MNTSSGLIFSIGWLGKSKDTKDPHYFDVDTKNFNMFMKYLTIYGKF